MHMTHMNISRNREELYKYSELIHVNDNIIQLKTFEILARRS
jgi:hypothetical protein